MSHMLRVRKDILGVTQTEMAAICRVTQATVSRWEGGSLSPSLVEVNLAIAEARRRKLKLEPADFFDAPANPEPVRKAG